jgi:hypothetical protein
MLCKQVRADVSDAALPPEEADVRWPGAIAEGVVETDDVVVGVAARGRQEADTRVRRPGEAEHVVVE